MHRIKRYRFLLRRRLRKIDKHLHAHPRLLGMGAAVTVCAFSAILFFSLTGRDAAISDAKVVILYADRKTSTLPTREETVGDFLEKEMISVNEGDVVEPSLDTKIEEDNFRVNVYRAAPVVVYDGDTKMLGLSAALTPRSMAEQTGARLYAEDIVTTGPSDDFLKDGSIGNKVIISRATPANLNLYGTSLAVRTHAKTVKELLDEKQVKLAADDTVLPGLDTELTPSTLVFVTRNGTQVVTEEVTIPMPTETVMDTSLSFGTSAVRQSGSAGKKSVTYQIELKNGVEVGRKIIQEVIIQEPVKQVVARGQAVQIPSDKEAVMRAAGIADSDFPYVYYIINRENGMWCPTRFQGQKTCPPYFEEPFAGAISNTSTGYGLCQATPGIKMASAGADWQTSAVTQMKWCSNYAITRYGSWEAAYNSWVVKHWW